MRFQWLCGLISLLLAGALAWLYRLHLAKVRSITRHLLEVRLSERARIARDLHDTILQGFHGLMCRLEAVRKMLPERPGDAAEFLDFAMEAGDQAIGEGRDAVRGLRSSSIQARHLETSLDGLDEEVAAAFEPLSRPRYRLVVAGRRRPLRTVIVDEAYRVAREAVRNAYEHAQAGHIETELIFGDSHLTIRVRDDGIGVDSLILARGQRQGHWGLPGMRERSEVMGGQFHISSSRSRGTEVQLRIPANIAYLVTGAEWPSIA